MSRLEKQIVKFKQDGLEIVGPSVVNGVEMNENEIKQYLETNERSREYYDIHLSVTELEDQLNVFSDYRTTLRNEVVRDLVREFLPCETSLFENTKVWEKYFTEVLENLESKLRY
jgi:hypothetical protein|tara:strand:- start:215 stop:559 length:345 start_codon:yes stop_codon:yes gene_type:complete